MKNLKLQIVVICSALIFPLFFPILIFSAELKIGDRAPNLIGLDAKSGKVINLSRLMTTMQFKRNENGDFVIGSDGKYISEFIDNVVILNFFQRSCIPCLKEIPTFNKIARKFITNNVAFLYINIDEGITIANAKQLIKKLKIRIPVMLPNQEEAIRQYFVLKLPRLIVIDKQKNIARIISGFEENLEPELTAFIKKLL